MLLRKIFRSHCIFIVLHMYVFALKDENKFSKYFKVLNTNLACFPEIASWELRKFHIQTQTFYKRCIPKSKIFGVTAFRRHRNQSWVNCKSNENNSCTMQSKQCRSIWDQKCWSTVCSYVIVSSYLPFQKVHWFFKWSSADYGFW